MHWIDFKCHNECSLQLPIRLKSLETGGKDHTGNFPESYRNPPFLLLVAFSSITELDMMDFLKEIFPLQIMCLKGVAASVLKSVKFLY